MYFMDSGLNVSDDVVGGQDLTAHVTGDAKITPARFAGKIGVKQYEWLIIVGALTMLWLLGGSFRRFIQ